MVMIYEMGNDVQDIFCPVPLSLHYSAVGGFERLGATLKWRTKFSRQKLRWLQHEVQLYLQISPIWDGCLYASLLPD